MSPTPLHSRWLTVALVATFLALAPLSSTAGQHRGGGSGGGNSGGNSGGGHTPSGGGQHVGTATPRSDGGSRSGGSSGGSSGGGETARTAPAGTGGSRGSDNSSNGSGGDTSHSRPRDGQPVAGRAVPRPGGGHGGGGGTIVVPGGGWYYPWGYGGFGFAGYYYGGGYDPWFDGDPNAYSPVYEGALRLKVKPREAQVFVDGYFAGQVDQYDGVFQRLTLDSGPHRIEVSAEGYETLSFDIRVIPDRTVTYEGELRRAQ